MTVVIGARCLLRPSIGIDAADLAAVMLNVGLSGSEQTLFENAAIRQISKGL